MERRFTSRVEKGTRSSEAEEADNQCRLIQESYMSNILLTFTESSVELDKSERICGCLQ